MNKTRKALLNEHNQPIGVVYTPKRKRTVLVANKEGVIERMKTSFRKELVGSMALVGELEMFDDSIYMLDSSILRGNDKIYSVSVNTRKMTQVSIVGIHNVKTWLCDFACDNQTLQLIFDATSGDEIMRGRLIKGKVVFL